MNPVVNSRDSGTAAAESCQMQQSGDGGGCRGGGGEEGLTARRCVELQSMSRTGMQDYQLCDIAGWVILQTP